MQALDKEIAEYKEKYSAAKHSWDTDRAMLVEVQTLKEQIQKYEHDATIAEKQTDYNKVAEIKYGKIPELQKKLEHIEQRIEDAKQA